MTSKIPSVKDTYFQHKVLTKIHGKPTYESLQTAFTELKANASSVPSTLGGGQHGHLGLLLSNARYTALPNSLPWTTPGNPGPFAPPAIGTGPQIDAAKDVWKDLKQTFELCQATEKALIAQIVETIDPIYLRALLNRATGQYSVSIHALVTHLFNTYGKMVFLMTTATIAVVATQLVARYWWSFQWSWQQPFSDSSVLLVTWCLCTYWYQLQHTFQRPSVFGFILKHDEWQHQRLLLVVTCWTDS
jgi:hypothetical protein